MGTAMSNQPTTPPECELWCGHEAYDLRCSDYQAQPCCGAIVNVDDAHEPDEHVDTCVNAPAWMRE